MQDYKKQFKGKKITVMGLGLLGGAVNDIIFLAKNRADLTVTDLKNAKELKSSIKKLKKYLKIKFVLGKHRMEDFKKADLILQPGNVPIDSPYLAEAGKNKIPIYVSESLFAKYASEVMMIGVTGTRGKSMVTALIYEILSKNLKKKKIYFGGNVRNVSTLALLGKVKFGDVVVMELDSWALHGMGNIKKSPYISIFTSFMPDHMNYYKNSMENYFNDKANIFKYQKKDDILIIRPDMKKFIKSKNVKGKLIVVNAKNMDKYNFSVPGKFQKENLACAVEVAKQFKIPDSKITQALKNFKGLEGRLQYIKTVKGVKIYNDNNATTPEATIAGIEALKNNKRNIILICGGADKKLPLDDFVKVVNKYCKAVIMIPGTGTDILSSRKLKVESYKVENLNKAVEKAKKLAKTEDIILFSPAFASFGQFNNEYERNDLFLKIIKKLK